MVTERTIQKEIYNNFGTPMRILIQDRHKNYNVSAQYASPSP